MGIFAYFLVSPWVFLLNFLVSPCVPELLFFVFRSPFSVALSISLLFFCCFLSSFLPSLFPYFLSFFIGLKVIFYDLSCLFFFCFMRRTSSTIRNWNASHQSSILSVFWFRVLDCSNNFVLLSCFLSQELFL